MQIGTSTSGTSAFDAMRAAFGSKNKDDPDSRLATGIMSAKDADKSGTLSAAELGVSQSNVAEFDTDGDGQVSQAELEAGLKAQREQMQNQLLQNGQLGMLQASMGQGAQGLDMSKMDTQMAQNIFAQKDADKSGGLSAAELGVTAAQLKKVDTDGDGQVSQDELTAALKANRESGGAGRAHHHHHKAAASDQTDQSGQTDGTDETGQTGQTAQAGNGMSATDLNNFITKLFSSSGSTGTTTSASTDSASLVGSLADYMLRQKASSAYQNQNQNVDQLMSSLFAGSAQAAQSVSATA